MEKNILLLITLYSQNSVEALEQETSGSLFESCLKMSFVDFCDKSWFISNKEIIRCYKRDIEALHERSSNNKDCITNCLDLVWNETVMEKYPQAILNNRMQILKILTIESFKKEWSREQISHYERVFKLLHENHTYFLSYTNHFAQKINADFSIIWQGLLLSDDRKDEDISKKNLIAKSLAAWLKNKNLKKGFFDDYVLRQGDDIEKIIREAGRSFAFIQLISTASFTFNADNWSFKEFQAFTKLDLAPKENPYDDQLMIFIVLEKNAIPDHELVPKEYAHWVETIKNKQYFELFKIKSLHEFTDYVDILIRSLINHRTRILQAIPD